MLRTRTTQHTLLVLVLALAAVACVARGSAPADSRSARMEVASAAPLTSPSAATDGALAKVEGRQAGETGGLRLRTMTDATGSLPGAPDALQRVARDSSATPAMIIRNGTTNIEVDSLDRAVALVRAIVTRAGGFVANTSAQTGRDQVHSSTLELRIPSARFDEVVSGLSPVGRVEGVNISAEDVGEQYVDAAARMANARKLEARLIDLLANSTGKLVEMLAVERELARVREEVERYEGRLRYLRTHAATSSLAVTLHEPLPIIAAAAHNPFVQAARDAWRNFVALLAAGIAALGFVVPAGAIAALGYAGLRRFRLHAQVR